MVIELVGNAGSGRTTALNRLSDLVINASLHPADTITAVLYQMPQGASVGVDEVADMYVDTALTKIAEARPDLHIYIAKRV